MKLSALLFSKDSAEHIEKALRSVQFADEVLLFDMMSQDATRTIAAPLVTQIYSHQDVGYVEPVRNFALSKATGDWVLVLDADEQVSPGLQATLVSIMRQADAGQTVADCYYMARKNMIFGEWAQTAGWWPDFVLRFFRNGHVEWSEAIHSVPITRGTVAELPAEEKVALIHENYQTVDQFVNRLNRYSSIQAKEIQSQKMPGESGPGAIVRAFRTELVSRLFAREGIAGGTHGVGLSFMQALSEVVVAMKTWQLSGKPGVKNAPAVVRELQDFQHDLAYWIADWHIRHEKGLRRWYWQVRRRLRV